MTPMQQATVFADTLSSAGYRVEVLDSPPGVNVWIDPLARYPADTVWFSKGEAVWGSNFQYVEQADAPDLEQQVLATLEPGK